MASELQTWPIKPSFFESREGTQVIWLGMAGALLNARGTLLLIDPLISLREPGDPPVNEIGYRLRLPLPVEARDVPRADLVLYTHGDEDHFGPLTAQTLAARTGCTFLAPPPVARMLTAAGIDPARIRTARAGERHQAGEATIEITPALHDWQEENPWQLQDCCGYVLRGPDGAVWHPGDTRLIEPLLEVRDIDVLFFDVAPIDSHLGPEGSARIAASCGARELIAYHYAPFDLPPGTFATFDPRDSLPYVRGLDARLRLLNLGEPLTVTRA